MKKRKIDDTIIFAETTRSCFSNTPSHHPVDPSPNPNTNSPPRRPLSPRCHLPPPSHAPPALSRRSGAGPPRQGGARPTPRADAAGVERGRLVGSTQPGWNGAAAVATGRCRRSVAGSRGWGGASLPPRCLHLRRGSCSQQAPRP